jgi:regulator of protease activity HflC (stomatin/prohibitin superfamily)
MRHAFVDIFDDVVGWMLLGVFVAAAIQVAVPGFLIESVFGPPLQAMLIMLVIGIPLYVCAEASTPIAAALIVQGVSPGAAFVFLLAGPATNIGAVGLLSRQLGRRTVVIYLATIAAVSVIFGLLLDWVFGLRGVNLSERALAEPFLPAWIKHGGAALFVLLTVFSMIRLRAYQRFAGLLDRALPMRVTPSRLTVTLIVVAMVAWFASGLAAVQPGQVGMIKQFGRVVAADVPPGLHYVWPYPIGSLDRIETREVHRLELGVSSTAQTAEDAEDDRSWVLLGDENIANIKCAAHWRMAAGQSRAFAYSTFDRELLVASAVRTALRGVLGGANIDTVFTTEQVSLSEKIHREAQHILDRSDCGIELVAFAFLDLHAPPQVHEAFRDVASALEDRATRRNQALTRQAEIEPLARGTREKLIRAARGDGLRLLGEAAGEADAFRDTLAAYEEFPYITRARMTFEMYDRILPGRRKFIRPASEHLQLDLRFRGGRTAGEGAMP